MKREELISDYRRLKYSLACIGSLVTIRELATKGELKNVLETRVPQFLDDFLGWLEGVNRMYEKEINYGKKGLERKEACKTSKN